MNKTISVNLGGRNFFIEEQAYNKLNAYLNAIKLRFAQYPGSEEIVSDMEGRIGEKFSEKYQNTPQAVISEADVDSLIVELGSVEDIAGEEGDKDGSKKSQSTFSGKRLMRNGDDKIIAGVCSGLAAYFDIDPFIFRIIFGVLIFAWGTIIPIYLLLWLIMPEAKTVTEKMQMRGEPVNLNSIGETIKERAEEFKQHVHNVKENKEWHEWKEEFKDKAKSAGNEMAGVAQKGGKGLGGFLRKLLSGITKIIIAFVKIISKIICLVLIIAFGIAIASLTLSFVAAVFNSNSPYLGLPLSGIAHGAVYYILLLLAYIIALIPLMLLFMFVIRLFTNKPSSLKASVGFSLFGVWLMALILGAALGARYIPGYVDQVKNSPQLQTVNKVYDAKGFNKLELSNSIRFTLIQGKEFSVKASGWAMDLDRLNVEVSGDTLKVSENFRGPCIFCFNGNPTVEIVAPEYLIIKASNSTFIQSNNLVSTSTILSLSNSSHAEINFNTKELIVNISNSSVANLTGSSTNITAHLSNSSYLAARDLLTQAADITTTNSSLANVNVRDNLKYSSSNSSRIYYLGNPFLEPDKNSGTFSPEPITPIEY